MEFKCNNCNRDFSSEESLTQHNSSKHITAVKKSTGFNSKKYIMISLVVLILVFSILTINSYMNKSGGYDEFAECLNEKGVIVYGNDFCQYTAKQLNFFGKSKENLNYVKCIDNEALCDEKGVSVTPTWEIDGQMYEQVQDFEKLSLLTGCEL